MNTLLLYILIFIAFVVLMIHLLDRHTGALILAIAFTVTIMIYLPPDILKFNNPLEWKQSLSEKSLNANMAIYKLNNKTLERDNITPSSRKVKIKQAIHVKVNGYDCEIRPDYVGKYVLVDNLFLNEFSADNRLIELLRAGFGDAFKLYIPCYSTTVKNTDKRFAIIITQPSSSYVEASQKFDECLDKAKENDIEFTLDGKILKLRQKEISINSP